MRLTVAPDGLRSRKPGGSHSRKKWPNRMSGRATSLLTLQVQSCLVQVVPQDLRAGRVPQLGHGLAFDLADALTRNAVDLADFV